MDGDAIYVPGYGLVPRAAHEYALGLTPNMPQANSSPYGMDHITPQMLMPQPPQASDHESSPVPLGAPKMGFLDRFALGLQGLQAPEPTGRQGDDFATSLLVGAAHGFSASRLKDFERQAHVNSLIDQYQHDQNTKNVEATKELRTWMLERAGHAADAKATEAAKGPPEAKPLDAADLEATGLPAQFLGRLPSDPAVRAALNGRTVTKPVAPDNAVADHKANRLFDIAHPLKDTAGVGGPAGPDDPNYVFTSPLGFKYVVTTQDGPKGKPALNKLAIDNGYAGISDKEKSALDLVAKARGHLHDTASLIGLPIPDGTDQIPDKIDYKGPLSDNTANVVKDFMTRGRDVMEAKFKRGIDADTFTKLKAMSDEAITMVQGMAALGTGMRINKDAIIMTLKNNVPQPGEPWQTARAKINTSLAMIDQTERALLAAHNEKQAATQGAAVAPTAAPATPKASARVTPKDYIKSLGIK